MVPVKGKGGSAKAAADRIGVLVLGMHRSGTSALTRALSLLGCDLPKTHVEAAPSNEPGHWESLPIARLNDRILDSAGSNWWDWMPFNPGWYSSTKMAEFKEEALSLLDEEFSHSRLFVLKDPRICRFAAFWIDVLETANIRPVVVMQLRNPLEVAESLSRRDGFHPALGRLLWLRNVLEAEAGTRGVSRYCTSYDTLLSNWPRIAAESQEALKISWPRLSLRAGGEINASLSGQLRHHKKSRDNVLDNSLLSDWLRDTFSTLDHWAEDGEKTEDHAVLDRIRTELDVSAPAFAELVAIGKYSADRAKAIEKSLEEIQEKMTAAESALEEKQAQIHSLEQGQLETAGTADRLAQAQTELAQLRAEAESQRAALEKIRGQLSHTQSELAQRQAEADDATRQLQTSRQRLVSEVEAERQRHETELTFQEQRHAEEILKERERHSAELAARAERDTEKLLDERERHDKELTEHRIRADKDLQELRQLKDETERRLAGRFGEIAALTRLLSERERQVQISDEKAARLNAISTVMLNGSASRSLKNRLGLLVPAALRLKKQKSRLKHARIFDPKAYLEANPDVAEAGIDPLWHYLNHGINEGRQLQPAPAEHEQGE